jgi:hypothetical protein
MDQWRKNHPEIFVRRLKNQTGLDKSEGATGTWTPSALRRVDLALPGLH